MKLTVLIALNLVIVGAFVFLFRKKNLLSYFSGGKWWLTWLSIAVITLMDELTSIFYAPAEAHRFIGTYAIAFIAITSLFMRFLSTRMVEIAEILEHHNIRGGGVYSFSYLVLGPTFSFIAVSSIIVDYVLTASISTVSAVENGLTFISLTQGQKLGIQFAIVWGIAGLNILGIKENARVTFGLFFVVALVLLSLLASALYEASPSSWNMIGDSFRFSTTKIGDLGFFKGYGFVIISISGCILAYSGIESVVQTAGLVKSWKDIGKAYVFLAVTTGLFTPIISALVLSSGLDPQQHETDLITQFAVHLNGIPFGVLVGIIASVALIMAVNTAYVASSELMERVAHRYNFHWIIKTNRRQSLYRIHILSATFFSIIILLTEGSQKILAEMYALGLVASFTINMGSLLYYRYFTGTKEIRGYNTSRFGTLILFILLASCFIYLSITKPYGIVLLSIVSALFLLVGFRVAMKRAPEKVEIESTDSPLQMVFALAESPGDKLDIYFKRPAESVSTSDPSVAYVSFYSPRAGIPQRLAPNHYRFANTNPSLFEGITELLYVLKYELPHKNVTVHFGWPQSSWIDR
ncbi:MAG: amino acid/polyamine/organocation transporter, superfamily, partial [Bacteroidetes bacterium]|nr:amino acid/polyamine/organocation transporter, superfamily [Bacteroidota bacterium]